jgi:hypothetical protein
VLTLYEVADWKLLSNSDGTDDNFFIKPANFNEDSSVRVCLQFEASIMYMVTAPVADHTSCTLD